MTAPAVMSTICTMIAVPTVSSMSTMPTVIHLTQYLFPEFHQQTPCCILIGHLAKPLSEAKCSVTIANHEVTLGSIRGKTCLLVMTVGRLCEDGKDMPPGGKDCQQTEKIGVKKCKELIIKNKLA